MSLPYWGHGAAGVGTAAVRVHRLVGDELLEEAARIIADSAFCKWTILPNQIDGLAGIGEFMIDMFMSTREHKYLERAQEIAETILWYVIERPDGITFPGRWLNRISLDYATGSAGIGMFLLRLLNPGPRYIVDLARALGGATGGAPPAIQATSAPIPNITANRTLAGIIRVDQTLRSR